VDEDDDDEDHEGFETDHDDHFSNTNPQHSHENGHTSSVNYPKVDDSPNKEPLSPMQDVPEGADIVAKPLAVPKPPPPPSSSLSSSREDIDMIKMSESKPYSKYSTMKPSKKGSGKIGPLLRKEIMVRNKFSSTSTLFVATTITNPNAEEIMKCMAAALFVHIEKGYKATKKVYYQIFSEVHNPLTKGPLDLISMPDIRVIHKFISTIFNVMKLDLECMIMCLVYVERVIELSSLTLDQTNWRRVVLSALILAAKVWEDLSVYNIDFISFFNNITVADLNKMEMVFLNLVQFQMGIPASLYAKYYFNLRTFSKLDEEHFPLKPLDRDGARRLEKRSKSTEDLAKLKFKKTLSLTQLKPVEVKTPAVLS